jgi:hypothetical protein
VQLPLPKHINEQTVLDAISIEKDVDGFHPMNIGSLAMRGRDPLFVSCTPKVRRVLTNACPLGGRVVLPPTPRLCPSTLTPSLSRCLVSFVVPH